MVRTTKKEYISQPQSATNMPGGQKAKKAKHNCNISRLKNQSRDLPSHSDSTPHPTPPQSEAPSPELSEVEDDLEPEADNDSELLNHFDSLKADFQQENVEDWSDDSEEGEDVGGMDELMELCKEDLTETMVNMMMEEDPNDLDWMPEKLKNKAAKQKGKAKGECL
jgi:hypothetical protein